MTIVDIVQRHARERPADIAFVFLDSAVRETHTVTFGVLDCEARTVAAYLQERAADGDCAVILMSEGLGFLRAFLGCLYARVVAVPCYPVHARKQTHIDMLTEILRSTRARFILAEDPYFASLTAWLAKSDLHGRVECIRIDDAVGDPQQWQASEGGQPHTAFLQFTSGSTRNPRGVMVSHANILANQALIAQSFGHDRSTIGVSWLPMYHDMGLVGHILQPLYLGVRSVLMSPMTFLSQPVSWLEAISRYRATTSGAPNFAYQLCVERVTPAQAEALDLACWDVAYIGAEPVRSATLDAFAAKFACRGFRKQSLLPCYGLAEATLFAAGSVKQSLPQTLAVSSEALRRGEIEVQPVAVEGTTDDPCAVNTQILVSSGVVGGEVSIAIVDPHTARLCASNRVGEIWIDHPSVANGYVNDPLETQAIFSAALTGAGTRHLRTGDLGFIHSGLLFITGRQRELIIIRGRNHYPQDIEITVQEADTGFETRAGAAFTVDAGAAQGLVVVQELSRAALRSRQPLGLVNKARRAIAEVHLVHPYDVVLIKPGTLPRTSSGKIRRQHTRELYLADALKVVMRWRESSLGAAQQAASTEGDEAPASDLECALVEIWQDVLGRAVGVNDDFLMLGGDSPKAMQIVARLREQLATELTMEGFLAAPTIRLLADDLALQKRVHLIAGDPLTHDRTNSSRQVYEL